MISGTPQKEGSFSFTVQADNGIGVSSQELSLYVAQREQEPVIKQYELTSGTALIDLGIHAEGEQSRKRLFLYNAGTDSLHLSDFPQSRYFDFSYAPIFDTNTDEEMQPAVIMWDRSLHRNLWMRHLMSRETVQEMKVPQMTRVLISQKMEKVIHHMTTETQMIQMDMVIIQKITVIIRGMILRDIDSIWKL